MTKRINTRLMKLYTSAKEDKNHVNGYTVKLKHLNKLQSLVQDFTENHFYYDSQNDLNEISNYLTIGCIEEVLSELKANK